MGRGGIPLQSVGRTNRPLCRPEPLLHHQGKRTSEFRLASTVINAIKETVKTILCRKDETSPMNSLSVDLVEYINLDTREDRQIHMEAQLAKCPYPCSRFPAVRLPALPKELGLKMKPGLEEATGVASIYQSHLNALRSAKDRLDTGVFVLLEDDCHIDPRVWERNIGISEITDWDIILLDPRYRSKKPQKPSEPKFAKEPFGNDPVMLRRVRRDYNCTGAHFCIFNGIDAVKKVINVLENIEEIRDVDNIYAFEFRTFGISTGLVRAGGFSSDHE